MTRQLIEWERNIYLSIYLVLFVLISFLLTVRKQPHIFTYMGYIWITLVTCVCYFNTDRHWPDNDNACLVILPKRSKLFGHSTTDNQIVCLFYRREPNCLVILPQRSKLFGHFATERVSDQTIVMLVWSFCHREPKTGHRSVRYVYPWDILWDYHYTSTRPVF